MSARNIVALTSFISAIAGVLFAAHGDIAGIAPDPIVQEAQKWAVIVGVGDYTDNGLSKLPNAINDALAVRDNLITAEDGYPADNVILLAGGVGDQSPTRTNIMKYVNSYFSQSGPDDTILFYFAGHGITDSESGMSDKQLYLMPNDSTLSNVPFSGLAFAQIEQIMKRAPAKSKILILDACHSGTGRSSTRLSQEAQREMLRASEGMVVLASCKADQLSHEMPDTGHGAFTYFLLDALAGNPRVDMDGDGLISAFEMNKYTRDKTNRWAMKQGFNQTPWHREEGAGDLYLAKVADPSVPRRVAPRPVAVAAVAARKPAARVETSPPALEDLDLTAEPEAPVMLAKIGEQRTGDVRTFSGIEFVWIPAGKFQMGTPAGQAGGLGDETLHWVALSKGFWISKYEITQAQWRRVTDKGVFHARGTNLPAENISWNEVQDFIRELNGHGQETFRLPTEAEWEYACRGGRSTAYGTGSRVDDLAEASWYVPGDTHEVGQKKANRWGVYDMHGNVWEWCADNYGSYPQATVTDPVGPEIGAHKSLRGGSVGSTPDECRSAFRRSAAADFRNYRVGFRLVR